MPSVLRHACHVCWPVQDATVRGAQNRFYSGGPARRSVQGSPLQSRKLSSGAGLSQSLQQHSERGSVRAVPRESSLTSAVAHACSTSGLTQGAASCLQQHPATGHSGALHPISAPPCLSQQLRTALQSAATTRQLPYRLQLATQKSTQQQRPLHSTASSLHGRQPFYETEPERRYAVVHPRISSDAVLEEGIQLVKTATGTTCVVPLLRDLLIT